MPKQFTTRERVERAEKAWDALWLGIVTQADRQRAVAVLDGLRALDDSRSKLAAEVERLVKLYRECTPPMCGGAGIVFRLCKELEQLYINEKKDDPCLEKKLPTVSSAGTPPSSREARPRPTAARTSRGKTARTAGTKTRAR